MSLKVAHIGEPFDQEGPVGAQDIAAQMVEVVLREILERRAELEFLGEMRHSPEKLGEALILEQVGILEQPENPVAVGAEKRPHRFKVRLSDGYRRMERRG